MAGDEYNVAIALDTIGEGKLNEEFQAVLPGLLAQLREGDKAGVTINLSFERIEGSPSLVEVSYKIAGKTPARQRVTLCRLTGDMKLKGKPPKPSNLTLLDGVDVTVTLGKS